MQSRLAKSALFISVVLYIACLTQDGYYIDTDNPDAWAPGYGLLMIGWMGVFYGVFAWLANPLLYLSWLFLALSMYRAAFFLSLGAFLFAASFLLHSEVVASEAPTYAKIIGYGIGYWLWVASAIILVAGTGILAFRPKTESRPDPGAVGP